MTWTQIWPVVTLILGYLVSRTDEARRDRAQRERDIEDRRRALHRDAIVALQEGLLELRWATGRAAIQAGELTGELADRMVGARSQVLAMASRIGAEDRERVRQLVGRFHTFYGSNKPPGSPNIEEWGALGAAVEDLVDDLGNKLQGVL